jgi:hypothetical protein
MMHEGRDSWSRALVVQAACAQGRIVSYLVVSRSIVSAGAGAGATCVVVSAVPASLALQAVMTSTATTRARRFIYVLLVEGVRAYGSSGPLIAMLGASGNYSTMRGCRVKSDGRGRSVRNARISEMLGGLRCG